ncbi:hypothetical protein GQ53DRAFT_632762, partial [Thozetella sp. PMI_491]
REHLYRRHLLPLHCDRCFAKFPDDETLRQHRRADVPCSVKPEPSWLQGLDRTKTDMLKRRPKKSEQQTEEEKWITVYKIIFPDVEDALIPSPCKFLLLANRRA